VQRGLPLERADGAHRLPVTDDDGEPSRSLLKILADCGVSRLAGRPRRRGPSLSNSGKSRVVFTAQPGPTTTVAVDTGPHRTRAGTSLSAAVSARRDLAAIRPSVPCGRARSAETSMRDAAGSWHPPRQP
jgi:hypothetical protein